MPHAVPSTGHGAPCGPPRVRPTYDSSPAAAMFVPPHCSMTDTDFEVAKAEFLTLKKANQARMAAGEVPEKSQQYLA